MEGKSTIGGEKMHGLNIMSHSAQRDSSGDLARLLMLGGACCTYWGNATRTVCELTELGLGSPTLCLAL